MSCMSWDIFVMDLPTGATTLDDIPQDYKPAILMTRAALIEGISKWSRPPTSSDPSWGLDRGAGLLH